jgi:two-component system chemotaxis response regulator CheB
MPQLDGLEATRRIMDEAPTPIVIVSAVLDPKNVDESLQALQAGALTIVPKPEGPGSSDFDQIRRQLVRTIKAMAGVKVVRRLPRRLSPAPPRPASGAQAPPARLVAIGASIGGPAALHRIVSGLPADFPAPILVVQHLAAGFVNGLASWLRHSCRLAVRIAEHGEALAPGTLYLAPDDRHLGATAGGTLVLSDAPPIGGFRPSATYLFESVAYSHGAEALAVILTGMGEDGVDGLRAVRQAGGRTLAQDESSCIVYGMPGAAVAAGLADIVLPVDEIGAYLRQHSAVRGAP